MSFLTRLFGRSNSAETRGEPDDLGDLRGDVPDNGLLLYAGPPHEVLGESHYRDAISHVTGGPRRDGVRLVTWAALVPEHDNPHDANAVAVRIDGAKVGHLARPDAAAFRDVLERIEGHGKVAHCRADICAGWNRSLNDVGDYSITLYVAGADRQSELISVELDGKTRAEIARRRPPLQPAAGHGPGFYRGRHNSEWFAEVSRLRQAGDDAAAEELLLGLVQATEEEARFGEHGVTPGGYQQLSVIYRKRKDTASELAILERFAAQAHAPGVTPAKLLDRLEALRARLTDA